MNSSCQLSIWCVYQFLEQCRMSCVPYVQCRINSPIALQSVEPDSRQWYIVTRFRIALHGHGLRPHWIFRSLHVDSRDTMVLQERTCRGGILLLVRSLCQQELNIRLAVFLACRGPAGAGAGSTAQRAIPQARFDTAPIRGEVLRRHAVVGVPRVSNTTSRASTWTTAVCARG